MAAAISSLSFTALGQATERRGPLYSVSRAFASNFYGYRIRTGTVSDPISVRSSNSSSRMVISAVTEIVYLHDIAKKEEIIFQNVLIPSPPQPFECTLAQLEDVPTVSETKLNFLKSYKRPVPSIYNSVLQELIVQQHLMRYKKTYQYDAVFALGFVTVYDQLMEGYPSNDDREAIFKAYIQALQEDPAQYRIDAQKLEEWARSQNASTLIDFSSRQGEVEDILKDISERAGGKGNFSYSRFIAIGLFRLLELANATEPTVLEKLCAALNINKRSVDRDLDVYRNLLSKLVQAKELLKEYVDREKKKREERSSESQKANEAVTKFMGEFKNANL
ncbi:protein THYLAKOID FORMATION1, chloroplastic [Cinnamomum micranthum f. kanehirae]|uniref:Protein THYLAKOID FORMATION1, chloroplastic n=1 Tax=Cinnamomum micranthum f. kanehirae TaxID=337451 RepID=A0A3S3N0N0_9MAGN|nr:protein THYLAKOID FORMATION1, chloroplastic [Cinnamomum micranthum f. kanehirae]